MKSLNFDDSSIDENGIHDFDLSVLETLIKFYIAEPTVSEDNIDNKVSNVGQLTSFLLFRKLVQMNQTKFSNPLMRGSLFNSVYYMTKTLGPSFILIDITLSDEILKP